jgi:FkbM family methyltransferase
MRAELKDRVRRMPPPLSAAARLMLIAPLRGYFRYAPGQAGKDFLWRRLMSHLWWLEREVKATTIFGDVLRVDASDIVGRYIYHFGIWEPNLTEWLRRTLQRGDVFVDVGANIGYFSILASRLVGPSGSVVAIEPLPEIHRNLQANLAANAVRNVRPVCAAAWDDHRSLEMFTRPTGPSGTSTAYASWATRWDLVPAATARAMPLAEMLRPDELNRLRVIKIDAEGAEWRILKSFAHVLAQCRRDVEIVVEVAPALLREDDATPEKMAALLRPEGFRPYRIENVYDASAYYRRDRGSRPPVQISEFPRDAEQFDVIFSRVNAASL